MAAAPKARLDRSIARRVDQIIAALDEPTAERIDAIAEFAEQEADRDPDVGRASMGRAFAAELRALAVLRRARPV